MFPLNNINEKRNCFFKKSCVMTEKGKHTIVGIHITDRTQNVPSVQNVLTQYGLFY